MKITSKPDIYYYIEQKRIRNFCIKHFGGLPMKIDPIYNPWDRRSRELTLVEWDFPNQLIISDELHNAIIEEARRVLDPTPVDPRDISQLLPEMEWEDPLSFVDFEALQWEPGAEGSL
jgi:hypothetical protein